MTKKTSSSNEKGKPEVGSAFDLLSKSWEIVKKNWLPFAFVNIFAILSAIFNGFDFNADKTTIGDGYYYNVEPSLEVAGILGAVGVFATLLLAINAILYTMLVVLHVESSKGKKPGVEELFKSINKNWLWLRLIGLFILMGVIITIGFILLIIPGIIAIGRVVMAPFIMVDKNLGIWDSIKASNELSKQHTGKVWAAIGVLILVAIATSILGVFPVIGPLVGALLSIAWSLVLVLRYQQLRAL